VIVDTSAVLAVLFKEPDAPYYARKIAASPCRMSVANILEAAIVIGGRGEAADAELDRFLHAAEIELAPVTAAQVARAREAWRVYGKGNHPAGLNFGDCFAYALALTTGEPLLFKGDDFSRTDVEAA
jgi:ribonuclease VapC